MAPASMRNHWNVDIGPTMKVALSEKRVTQKHITDDNLRKHPTIATCPCLTVMTIVLYLAKLPPLRVED